MRQGTPAGPCDRPLPRRRFLHRYLAIAAMLAAATLASRTATAHVGSPDTFFAGSAGPWVVRVTVRPPGVVPGLAGIAVRVEGRGEAEAAPVRRVTVRPMRTDTGARGAPAPDVAVPVPGQPGLYSGSLWLMSRGAYTIEVVVEGSAVTGRVLVPVEAVATRQLPMGRALAFLVGAFAVLLVSGGLAIVYAAVRESTLRPGEAPSPGLRRRAIRATWTAALVFGALILGESRWSARVAGAAGRDLYRPYHVQADVRRDGSGGRMLRLSIDDPRWRGKDWHALVPDHGKIMHLFAMREPALDAFAHLHPVAVSERAFETPLPPLPAGAYSIFADVTDETGFAETLVCRAEIPAALPGPGASGSLPSEGQAGADPDDSWRVAPPLPPVVRSPARADLGAGYTMQWEGATGEGAPVAGRERPLTFSVADAAGASAALEPYMGMRAHAAVLRDDGSVFVHLHPMGTVSMASLDASRKMDAASSVPDAHAGMHGGAGAGAEKADGRIVLPYSFPTSGPYRIWVQVRTGGEIRTGVFDVMVR